MPGIVPGMVALGVSAGVAVGCPCGVAVAVGAGVDGVHAAIHTDPSRNVPGAELPVPVLRLGRGA